MTFFLRVSHSAEIVRFISNLLIILIERDGAVWSARRAHNPEVGGSNPSPAIGPYRIVGINSNSLKTNEYDTPSRYRIVVLHEIANLGPSGLPGSIPGAGVCFLGLFDDNKFISSRVFCFVECFISSLFKLLFCIFFLKLGQSSTNTNPIFF